MKTLVTISPLPIEIAEPILRDAAYRYARYSALLDLPSTMHNLPTGHGQRYEDARAVWLAGFKEARTLCLAFGVLDPENTSDEEREYITFPHWVGGRRKIISVPGLGKFSRHSGGKPDLKRPVRTYRGGIHTEACHAAADRTVKAWRASFEPATESSSIELREIRP
jgi:hypothetical protein